VVEPCAAGLDHVVELAEEFEAQRAEEPLGMAGPSSVSVPTSDNHRHTLDR
jgi:hypothetical protein